MGGSHGRFTKGELQEYADLTYFSKKEILQMYKRFRLIDPSIRTTDRYVSIRFEKVCQIPELKVNPFCDRICKVFASSDDGTFVFEDFLDMMSAFSDLAPKSVKAEWAFKIYDFNEDDCIDYEDLAKVVNRLTGDSGVLTKTEMDQLVENVMREADMDDDKKLSFAEFEHVIARCPDFMSSFRIRL